MVTKPTVLGNLKFMFPDSEGCTSNTTYVLTAVYNSYMNLFWTTMKLWTLNNEHEQSNNVSWELGQTTNISLPWLYLHLVEESSRVPVNLKAMLVDA